MFPSTSALSVSRAVNGGKAATPAGVASSWISCSGGDDRLQARMPPASATCSRPSHPGGMPAGSRWLSAAIPPDNRRQKAMSHPGRVPASTRLAPVPEPSPEPNAPKSSCTPEGCQPVRPIPCRQTRAVPPAGVGSCWVSSSGGGDRRHHRLQAGMPPASIPPRTCSPAGTVREKPHAGMPPASVTCFRPSHPGGMPAGSRWLSAAIPPEPDAPMPSRTPAGCQLNRDTARRRPPWVSEETPPTPPGTISAGGAPPGARHNRAPSRVPRR